MMRVIIPTEVFKAALLLKMFGHAGISKRLRWQATKADMGRMDLFSGILSWYEAEAIPFRKLLNRRFAVAYLARWREVLLYARLASGVLRGRGLRVQEEQLLSGLPTPLPAR